MRRSLFEKYFTAPFSVYIPLGVKANACSAQATNYSLPGTLAPVLYQMRTQTLRVYRQSNPTNRNTHLYSPLALCYGLISHMKD